jgi:hypothetical protein
MQPPTDQHAHSNAPQGQQQRPPLSMGGRCRCVKGKRDCQDTEGTYGPACLCHESQAALFELGEARAHALVARAGRSGRRLTKSTALCQPAFDRLVNLVAHCLLVVVNDSLLLSLFLSFGKGGICLPR